MHEFLNSVKDMKYSTMQQLMLNVMLKVNVKFPIHPN